MVWNILKLRTQNLNKSKKTGKYYASDSWKSALRMVSEDPQKNIAKKY